MPEKTFVIKPFLPPLKEIQPYLEEIWDSRWLTNNGKFHEELEEKLARHLGVKYVSLFANGTLALILALQSLRITGEVITTPYSFVATTHSLWWNNIKPVFVDIEPEYLNINPKKIEAAITPQTTAIMPVHIYGNPCKVKETQEIADTYGLRVIYDACHAFGVKIKNKSILDYGDLSILSFHATKIFTTFEGGAIICHSSKMKKRIDFLKNFGFADETTVVGPGINAKMNEFQSALGLIQLKYINKVILKRKKITNHYRKLLNNITGIKYFNDISNVSHNYSYFPIIINSSVFHKSRDQVYEELKSNNIFTRRYFYPLITHFSPYRSIESAHSSNLPVAEEISKGILCLPIYPDLQLDEVERIVNILTR